VAVAVIAHETWQVATVGLGGEEIASVRSSHRRDPAEVLGAVGDELRSVRRRYGSRVRAVAVSVPGTVSGTRLAHAPNLGWHDIELSALWPRDRSDRPFLAGNDATFAAIAESRRGSSLGASTTVHLFMDAGIGGAVIEGDRALIGATGMAGEFGHMPFGDPAVRCPCGALGCWNTTVGGAALAHMLHRPLPADEVSYSRRVIAAAQSISASQAAQPEELAAVRAVARSVGRGAAGLVNAFDPDIVTLGGLGRELLEVAGDHLYPAYLAGLMRFRTSPPPPLVPARFGEEASLVGATEDAFAAVLTDDGLRSWSRLNQRA
jgi:predicted NBD/HSP70 family sugar kinase